jgi:alanyl-tRNA synthetase
MTSSEIRQQFLEFFRERGHTIVPSAPVIPRDDPTLLFTNAGMNQFKPIFLGRQKPDFTRAADTQKCIRVSGKHNDLEEVGPSPYHHTFFEMLGNWSFGDYFKREAITWAWELTTGVYGISKDRMYATVYETDDEADKLWKSLTDINPSHVLRFGKKDNFWSMGDTGPCGPCSELHVDRGPDFDKNPKAFVNTGSPRFLEVWNLVFIQYDCQPDGTLVPLPSKHVDTGAGLERLTSVMNNYRSNYDTDLFQPIIRRIAEAAGRPYTDNERGVPHRVIADHLRCLSFAIADGAMPGNEGRGYVLRRLLRRASRFARKLEMHEPFIYKLVPVLVDVMGETFPELKERHVHIARVIQAEEEHFGKTLDRGLEIFDKVVANARAVKASQIPGEEAFRLYDTFGFPLDLMELMAREEKLEIDTAGFDHAMQSQRQRARSAGSFKAEAVSTENNTVLEPTRFVGYDVLETETEIRFVAPDPEDQSFLVTARETPFYAEAGGQIADTGLIETLPNGLSHALKLSVTGVEKYGDGIVHRAHVSLPEEFEKLIVGFPAMQTRWLKARLAVRLDARIPTQYNHTATHLLQAALRQALGSHVHQAGSYVGPDYLRFDYTHYEKPTDDELRRIEAIVNQRIRENWPVTPKVTSLKEAQAAGAMALFGEKYGDEVRMIEIGASEHVVSRELCGGCHVKRTGDIGVFVIKTETSAAAGVRRIEALTGDRALNYLLERRDKVDDFTIELGSEGSDPLEKLRKFIDERKKLEKELEQLRNKAASSAMQELSARAIPVGRARLVAAQVNAQNMDQLKEMGDALRDSLKSGVGVLASVFDGKPSLVVVVTPDLVKSGVDAVPIVKELGKRLQGGGGGKPHLATAGGKNAAGIKDVLTDAEKIVAEYLK